jgi:hypothetical protein
MDLGSLMNRIRILDEGLKEVNPGLGYTKVVGQTGAVVYRVCDMVFPPKDIPGGQGGIMGLDALLQELVRVAQYWKPSLLLPDNPTIPDYPDWLAPDAVEFLKQPERGLHWFGKVIIIPGTEEEMGCTTKEQLIFASTTSLEMFRYWSTNRQDYSKDLYYNACMHWNLSLYYYIERQGLSPSQAITRLTTLQRKLIEEILAHLRHEARVSSCERLVNSLVGAHTEYLEEIFAAIPR